MTGIMTAAAGTSRNVIYTPGLFRRTYSGYFNDNVNYFDSATPTASAVDTSPIGPPSNVAVTSYQWLGYWLATSDTMQFGETSFELATEDGSWLWIGSTARTGYTTGNALINNGGLRNSVQTVEGQTPLTMGLYYPIRIQYGVNNIGTPQPGNRFEFRVFSNDALDFVTSMASNVFYNSLTNGL
jgi:hypothetical protein